MQKCKLGCKVRYFLLYVIGKCEKRKIILLNRNLTSFLYDILSIKYFVKIFLILRPRESFKIQRKGLWSKISHSQPSLK